MDTIKQNKKQSSAVKTNTLESVWRKPINLNEFEQADPLENLYLGRELTKSGENSKTNSVETGKKASLPLQAKSELPEISKRQEKFLKPDGKKQSQAIDKTNWDEDDELFVANPLTEDELKKILKIKNQLFRFADIQEILRGKSFDIYAYLRILAGSAGMCKIRHLELMQKLDISRPTLFKQEEWLVRLRLIEKRNVPGDHLGTSYTVHRFEDVLPVPKALYRQLHAHIEKIHKEFE